LDTTNRILPGAWSILEQDFARHAPAYIVQSLSERDRKYPMSHFPILANLVAAEYRPILRNSESVIYQRVEAVR
jgi:hypothetical protein